jgi:hypothetical protein
MSLPIVRVTVLEDRAQVLRRGRLERVEGREVLELELAPVLADKSLSVRVKGADLVGSRILRERIQRAPETEEAVLEERLRQAQAGLEAAQRAAQSQRAELDLWVRSQQLHLEELGEDAAWGRVDTSAWSEGLSVLSAEEDRLRQSLVRQRHEQERRERAVQDLQLRLRAARSPTSRDRLLLRIELSGQGGPAELELEYLVPCACWRPWHQARLEGEQLSWRSDACVWQNTGEDWTDVELRVSTERPSLGTEPPTLQAEVLRAQKVGSQVRVEAREQSLQTTGLGGARTSARLPGVDDGGQPLHLGGGRATVPSDGRPHRVPLLSFSSPAQLSHQLKGQVLGAVLLRTEADNTSPHPVLAGPVDLVRDSGFVGRTKILFVAPGERFELGWGPDPALRVHRSERTEEREARMLSSWSATDHVVDLKLSNIGPEPRRVEVLERVPVSEVEKVKVEVDGETADADGFVRWDVELPAYGTSALDLRWTLKKHSDVSGV